MLRLIILFIIGAFIYSLWKWTMRRFNRLKENLQWPSQSSLKSTDEGATSELVQDPNCKLYIAKEGAISYKGHYFCSDKCKDEWRS